MPAAKLLLGRTSVNCPVCGSTFHDIEFHRRYTLEFLTDDGRWQQVRDRNGEYLFTRGTANTLKRMVERTTGALTRIIPYPDLIK
jgi:hypothetical protein